jgi:phosphoribosylformylglycinamidine (FGAM) synthase-like amidotransferase family enzyme
MLCGGFQKADLGEADEVVKFLSGTKLGSEIKDFKLVAYEKQLVNGFNHRLTFEDGNGNKREVTVYQSFNGQFELEGEPTIAIEKVEETIEVPVMLCGGFQKADLGEADEVVKFLSGTKLGSEIKDFKLVAYEKQLVNGFNHRLTFEDGNGNKREVTVYQSFNGQFELEGEPTIAIEKVEETIEVPVMLCGGFQKADLGEADEVVKFLSGTKLGSEIKDFKLVAYEKQLVNGFNHRLTFEDGNGNKREVTVYQSFNGQFELEGEPTIAIEKSRRDY